MMRQLIWSVKPEKVASGPIMVTVTCSRPPCFPGFGPPYAVKLWNAVMTHVPRAMIVPSGLECVKEPPPIAVLLELSKLPEPVNWIMSPATIGVPGIVAPAKAMFGPIKLKPNAVLLIACTLRIGCAADRTRKEARIITPNLDLPVSCRLCVMIVSLIVGD